RPDRRGARAEGRAGLHRPVPPGGRPRPARRPLPLRPLPGAGRRVSTPEENVDLVKSFLVTTRDEGLGAVVLQAERFMHPDVEWSPGVSTLGQPTYHGIDDVREHIRKTASISAGDMTIQEVRP